VTAHAVFAGQDALDDGNHGVMLVRALGCGNGGLMRRCDIGKQVAGVLLANDVGVGQGEQERLAYAECCGAIGIKAYTFGHLISIDSSHGARLACPADPIPGLRIESGYFRSLIGSCGDGTEGKDDRGDHRLLA